MAFGEITVRLELSPMALETFDRLTAEICALRDELERLNCDDGPRISEKVQACLTRLDVLGGLFKAETL